MKLLNIYTNKNDIIISINRKMPIRILTSNNRIIIKENFAKNYKKNYLSFIFITKKKTFPLHKIDLFSN